MPDLLTVAEAAELARCVPKTVRRAVASGALAAFRRRVRKGGHPTLLFTRAAVDAWRFGETTREAAEPKAVVPRPYEVQHLR